ncbi:DUF3304 domain-containing protein [Propionivibrio soli]|uniref:DUF3304 domain-containing protein n=1 Tax=Propionivibrio soli TaxID=2976531 RepID=UPI0021E7146F|nr:DUF3304 domain-containing protein [Propionivibrio soli]
MKWFVSLICAALLSGCVTAQQKPQDALAGAQVGVVNHTGKYIYSSFVDGVPNGDLPIVGGGSGANMSAWGAGIASTCCASIPRVWYPGMKVLVQWNMPDGTKDVIKEKIVEVEKYDRPGSIYLHFFPNDEVRVVITNVGPLNPNHPISPPVKPAPALPSK